MNVRARDRLSMRSLQARIIVFFMLLMLAVQMGGIAVTNTVGRSIARHTVGESLVTGAQVFDRLLSQANEQLMQSARVLASDYAFREAVATDDRKTVASALANHGARLKADVVLLVGLDRMVIADAKGDDSAGSQMALPTLVADAKRQGASSAMAFVGDKPYQLVIVPVLAPRPVAWLVVGYAVDSRLARDLGNVTSLEVSFLSRKSQQAWVVDGTTLPDALKANLVAIVDDAQGTEQVSMSAGGDEYPTLVSRRGGGDQDEIVVMLQKSLRHLLEPFDQLRHTLITIALIGLVLTLAGSVMIARGIAGPVRSLAAFARRIAHGEYVAPPHVEREDEIGDLATAFEHMRGELSARESRIANLAYHDPLTGLPNRVLFSDRLQQAIGVSQASGAPLAVMLMDLDRFKFVNDSLGHHIGDLLLMEVAQRLRETLERRSDTVARLGGDEFAILLPGVDAYIAGQIAIEIQEALQTPMTLEGQQVDICGSIGIAICPQHGEDLAVLLQRADVAMYLAKRQNAGHAVYDMAHDENSRGRLSLMGELMHAVEHDELVLHYQPKVDLSGSGELHAEALVRWMHPVRGLISPGDFIPFAEQTGYVKAITAWVLDRSIAQCAAWRRSGIAVSVSTNISARDLMSSDLPKQFAAMLERHGCRAEWMCLEIVESAILEDPRHGIENLERLSALGCRLSIDDYGTGYSSLSYLKRMPVDELKIDKSFVMGMMADRDDAVIVKSTIDLGHNMGLSVVAEGVEDQWTFNRLRELGCNRAQGFLMSKPLPADEFVHWAHLNRRSEAAVANGRLRFVPVANLL